MTLEKLQQKRAALVAARDQHLANLNVATGAIAMCDELIAEHQAEIDAMKSDAIQKVADELAKMQREAAPVDAGEAANGAAPDPADAG